MKLLRIFRQGSQNRGFTLLEILIGLSILIFLIGLGLFLSMDFFRTYAFNYERNLVMSILQRARSRAMANIDQVSHGACYDPIRKAYVLFNDSSSCFTSAEIFSISKGITNSGFSGVVFNQLDGKTVSSSITLTDQGQTSTITINNEGAVLY